MLITITDTEASEVQTLWCMQSMYSKVWSPLPVGG